MRRFYLSILLPAIVIFVMMFSFQSKALAFPTGWIVFSATSVSEGNWDIWAIRPDGSGLTQLTDSPQHEYMPSWSPDYTKFVFATANQQLWVYDWNTKTQTKIYDAHDYEGQDLGSYLVQEPSWSPDGNRILFREDESYNNPHISVINSDGTGRQIVPVESGYVAAPSWAPNNQAIVFERRNYGPGSSDLWVYDFSSSGDIMSGTNTRLTSGAQNESTTKYFPDWGSNDLITYTEGHNLAIIEPDNGDMTFLTSNADFSSGIVYVSPAWSPDSLYIVYGYRQGSSETYDLWLMDVDTGISSQLTNTTGFHEDFPAWGNPESIPELNTLLLLGLSLVCCYKNYFRRLR